jgi:hypothetical protein
MKDPFVIAALLALMGTPTLAEPRLDDTLDSPTVDARALEVEAHVAAERGPGDFGGATNIQEEIAWGVSSRFRVAMPLVIKREPGGRTHLASLGVEGQVYLGKAPGIGVDVGVNFEYDKGVDGAHDGGEAKLLLAKTAGRFQGLLNLVVEHPFHVPAGQSFASYGYGASMTWRLIGRLRVGGEAFSDLGNDHGLLKGPQGAHVGPELKWSTGLKGAPVGVTIDAGWLFPVGVERESGRGQARIEIELEHRF